MQNTTTTSKGKIFLLMGYLGSGKTTFIRTLLTNKQGTKYAIIQNQFASGQMGIQQPLIMDQSGTPFSSFLQLPNGCICCSAKNDLMASVQYIMNNTDVKNVIVQTNGLADPAQSIKQFWFDQQMKINAQLHSIISILPITRYQQLQKQQLFNKQIAYANKILLTFIDKINPIESKDSSNNQNNENSSLIEIDNVEKSIKQINQNCIIARNNDYNIVQFLAGDNMFDLSKLMVQNNNKNQHNHQQHSIHQGIQSIFIKGTIENCSKINQFQCRVGQLLWESQFSANIMRIKGAICLDKSQSSCIYELQGVNDIFEIKESKTSVEKVNFQTRILIIGRQLDEKKIREEILKITQINSSDKESK